LACRSCAGRLKLLAILVGSFRGDQAMASAVKGFRAATFPPFLVEPGAGNLLALTVFIDGENRVVHIRLACWAGEYKESPARWCERSYMRRKAVLSRDYGTKSSFVVRPSIRRIGLIGREALSHLAHLLSSELPPFIGNVDGDAKFLRCQL